MASAEKICVICGEDCSGRPRTRDKGGRYYCTACHRQALATRARREELVHEPAPAPVPVPIERGSSSVRLGPRHALIGGAVLLLAILAALSLLAPEIALLALLGAIAALWVYTIVVLVVAFRASVLSGVLCLLVPFYAWIFVFTGDHPVLRRWLLGLLGALVLTAPAIHFADESATARADAALARPLPRLSPRPPSAAESPAAAEAPTGPIIFQPRLTWASGEIFVGGTGFFVMAPTGEVAAVTSAHLVGTTGPGLLHADWMSVPGSELRATLTHSWGQPGHAGDDSAEGAGRDYLVMPADMHVWQSVLELDERPSPGIGERVWLPDKSWTSPVGYALVDGTVLESSAAYSVVSLDRTIELESQSGSPVISQRSGRVIGLVSRAGTDDDRTILLLTPAASILRALSSADRPPLSEVVGQPERAP